MSKRRNTRATIIPPEDTNHIRSIALNRIFEENYPLFCFKYLNKVSISECQDHKFFINFLFRLKALSNLGWNEIRKTQRHGYGMEQIPIEQIKPQLPICVTPDVKALHVFRANGDNRPFIGIQIDRVFRIFFIETKFGDIYDH